MVCPQRLLAEEMSPFPVTHSKQPSCIHCLACSGLILPQYNSTCAELRGQGLLDAVIPGHSCKAQADWQLVPHKVAVFQAERHGFWLHLLWGQIQAGLWPITDACKEHGDTHEGRDERQSSPTSHTQPQMAGEVSQHSNVMPATTQHKVWIKVDTSELEVPCVLPGRWECSPCLACSLTL